MNGPNNKIIKINNITIPTNRFDRQCAHAYVCILVKYNKQTKKNCKEFGWFGMVNLNRNIHQLLHGHLFPTVSYEINVNQDGRTDVRFLLN